MRKFFKGPIGRVLIGLVVFITGFYLFSNYYSNPDVSGRKLTTDEQRSLIDTQRTALLSNAKPIDVFAALESRYEQLSDENKAIAVELMYISQQNATMYYNNMMYIMGGEISVNRPKDSMNSLDAAKKSAWVAGYIQDLKNQRLIPLNLNEDMILAMPNFKALEKYKNDATPSLRHLIEIGIQFQDMNLYTDKYFDSHSAAILFDSVMSKYQEIEGTNAEEYKQHILSIARLIHDSIFGFLQTNNIEWQMNGNGEFLVSDKQIKDIETISKSELSLNTKAKEYIDNVDGKMISSAYISEKSISSIKEFGQSVYMSSSADIDNYYKVTPDGEIDKNEFSENQPKEEVEEVDEITDLNETTTKEE